MRVAAARRGSLSVFIRIMGKEEARNMDYLSACPEAGRAAQAPAAADRAMACTRIAA
jgi:hypothetical protein